MHTPDEQAWNRSDIQQEVEVENVADYRSDRPRATIELVIRHVDVSEPISLGPWNVSGSLGSVLQTCETYLPAFLSDMEVRVPEARRATLPPNDLWRAVFSEGVAIEVVVFDSEVQR